MSFAPGTLVEPNFTDLKSKSSSSGPSIPNGDALVQVRKVKNLLGLCGDHSSAVKQVSQKVSYRLPTAQEALSQLQGGKLFITLVFTQAYHQLPVIPEAAAVLTATPLKGL